MAGLIKRKRDRGMNEIPMASTSDVAFLLLIFFIVMPMKSQEIGLSMVLPAKAEKSTTVNIRQSQLATIRIMPGDRITFDGKPIQRGGRLSSNETSR